jgi:hypothetical protein
MKELNNEAVEASGCKDLFDGASQEGLTGSSHDEVCPGNIALKIPTYPGSSKTITIYVCDKCEPQWRDYARSSPAAYF